MKKRRFSIGTLSDIGYVKKTNQDRILIKIGEEYLGEFGLFVVADGMGGLKAGDMASEIVIKEFKYWWDSRLSLVVKEMNKINLNTIGGELDNLIFHINKRIIEFGKSINGRVGTTLSMLLIYRDQYIIKHIGDSRIYKINDDMIMLTKDDSWVAEQVRLGIMNIEKAANHPKKHVLLKCIGIKEELDIFENKGEVFKEDIFLLCSDGFYNLLIKDEILRALKEFKENDMQKTVEKLMGIVKSRGAPDNASVILIYQNCRKEKINLYEKIVNMLR
ncbi:PP2C family protein-serine/threonine phosphatase [Maledivibacter halophilus]|uniref:Serine/threonine protein phosphatase PrpC n=1 Tax=Maledivibacter halophilus TaxID=36842 RepID=A0A1T5IF89_9FIRM|nr:protein phosphatase 2C domain-containing protein [Maledivibacter halophilus]SKC37856.1 Serine/threonine protein phosphatase PrpC [Maledivibacter halophilus]